jgi:phosphotriesterase-related protein
MTVLGAVDPGDLGHVQMHEHLFCDLNSYGLAAGEEAEITLENVYATRVDNTNPADFRLDEHDVATAETLLYAEAGGGTMVEATSRGLGRDPEGLAVVSRATGVHVVMGSGYYIDPFHPSTVEAATVDEIAAEMVADIEVGVGETGIRAGILGEIGLSWPPTDNEQKVLRAAVLAQQHTGAALLLHPGRGTEAPAAHLAVVREMGGDLSRTIVSHIDRTLFRVDDMISLAESTGAVLEFDLFGDESSYYPPNPRIDRPNDGMRVAIIGELIARGLVQQIAISQDICRKTRLTRYGGDGYGHILRRVLPLMADRGIAAEDVHTITVRRPAELLAMPSSSAAREHTA